MEPEEPALLAGDQDEAGAIAAYQFHPLAAHPVGHQDYDLMAQGAPQCGECDTGIAAGGFRDRIPRRKAAVLAGAAEDVEGHPVFDAAGHVQLLAFGVDDAAPASIAQLDGKHRCVAQQSSQAPQPGACSRIKGSARQHRKSENNSFYVALLPL